MIQTPLYPVLIHKNVDCETPVSIYQKIRQPGLPSFLLESVEGQEKWARYSFIGFQPLATFQSRGTQTILTLAGRQKKKKVTDPFLEWEQFFRSFKIVSSSQKDEQRSRFFGGAVGYLSYEMIRHFEKIGGRKVKDDLAAPDCFFMIPEILLVFDNIRHRLDLIGFATKDRLKEVERRLKEISLRIDSGVGAPLGAPKKEGTASSAPTKLNWSPAAFKKAVSRVKNYIVAGDVTQTVLSLRQS
ncbi:MAG: hypothetical protein Q7S98_02700, partial [Deltaproteobacteria bacterium]|nr:hypothetical protein [Deltaproteobacteria bacterium]